MNTMLIIKGSITDYDMIIKEINTKVDDMTMATKRINDIEGACRTLGFRFKLESITPVK